MMAVTVVVLIVRHLRLDGVDTSPAVLELSDTSTGVPVPSCPPRQMVFCIHGQGRAPRSTLTVVILPASAPVEGWIGSTETDPPAGLAK
jgi:hypothetical protein